MRAVGREHEKSMICGTLYKQVWVDPPGQATGARNEGFTFERQRKFPLTTYGSVYANPHPQESHGEIARANKMRKRKKGQFLFLRL